MSLIERFLLGLLLIGHYAKADCSPSAVFARSANLKKLNQERSSVWLVAIKSFYQDLKQPGCDDGVAGEAFSEAVTKRLASHWKDSGVLLDEMQSDPAFRAKVIEHIDASADHDDLGKIAKSATLDCPKKYQDICGRIAAAASLALTKMSSVEKTK